jgi:hypothetical protein
VTIISVQNVLAKSHDIMFLRDITFSSPLYSLQLKDVNNKTQWVLKTANARYWSRAVAIEVCLSFEHAFLCKKKSISVSFQYWPQNRHFLQLGMRG